MRRLWAGLAPRIVMIGTISALQWFIYDGFKVYGSSVVAGPRERLKVAVGLPRPPPPSMPESLKRKLERNEKLVRSA